MTKTNALLVILIVVVLFGHKGGLGYIALSDIKFDIESAYYRWKGNR